MPCPPPLPRESPSPSQIKKKYVGKENDKKWEKEDVRRKNTFRATPPPTQFTCHEFNSPPTSSHYWHQFWGDEVVLCQIFLTEDNILLSTSSNFSFWNLNLKEIIEGSIPSDPFSLAPPPHSNETDTTAAPIPQLSIEIFQNCHRYN